MHTFYEALGYMINAQTDSGLQEKLIEKYMLLPNQIWDNIISQATKVSLTSWYSNHSHCYVTGVWPY